MDIPFERFVPFARILSPIQPRLTVSASPTSSIVSDILQNQSRLNNLSTQPKSSNHGSPICLAHFHLGPANTSSACSSLMKGRGGDTV